MSKRRLTCPACHGYGGETVPILDYGEGPFEPCGFCNATGEVTRKRFYVTLGYLSGLKRKRKKSTCQQPTPY